MVTRIFSLVRTVRRSLEQFFGFFYLVRVPLVSHRPQTPVTILYRELGRLFQLIHSSRFLETYPLIRFIVLALFDVL